MKGEEKMDWLERWNLYSPQKIALKDVVEKQNYTYGDFFRMANCMAHHLRTEFDVQFGDRVAVFAHNRVETIFLFFALQRLGAILVPINFRLAPSETDFILHDSGAKILFYDSMFADLPERLQSQVQSLPFSLLHQWSQDGRTFENVVPFQGQFDEACKILYTSGTTGFPKGVVITPKILFWNSINTSMSLDLTSHDVTVNFSPFFHTGGWNVLLTPFIHRGGTTILLPKFDAEKVLDIIEEEKVTLFFGVPTTLGMMALTEGFQNRDFSSVRYAIVGGEPMPLNMIRTWDDKGVSIRQGFGLTECGPNCFSLSEKDAIRKMGSIGRPNFYVQTRVVNNENEDVAAGQVGELLLKGPMCMTQYWQNSEATRASFFEEWLRTGDLVKTDEDFYFYVVGRKKEMFISGGENIYPAEVEKVISRHPAVAEVAVLGVEDPQWGEVGRAFVVTTHKQPIDAMELTQFCRDQMASFKIPKQFDFIDEMPKGDSGKILKKELFKRIEGVL